MRKDIKNYVVLGLAAAMTVTSLAGCQKQEEPAQTAAAKAETTETAGAAAEASAEAVSELSGELEMVTNASESIFEAVSTILDKFMEENPGVKIDYSTQGSDYEQLMKARMASNDLPDIFATHGWSVVRYSEYLRPLTDQPWASNVEESFLSNIQDKNGDIFVLPINMDMGGIICNQTILDELGAELPKTWDEFQTVCDQAKEKGYISVFIAGKDSRQPANLLDIAGTSYLAACEDKGYAAQLDDGSFDWNNWTPVSQLLLGLKEGGYLNVDCVTCDPVDIPARMAENNILFLFSSSPDLIGQALELNPDLKYSMGPVPAVDESYSQIFCGGEREAYGIWKDTEHEDICLALIEYLSRPENVKIVCEASGKRPAIQNVDADLGTVADDYAKYADIPVYPFLDRVYLPNGMWSTMKTIGSALIGGEMTVDESVKAMETDYQTLRSQN